ncbi:predicted protein [Chaetomium globosum CBS 148.51]|uniref:Uncharacterized protein n=1 Tax=Chaetomium globosum (strain ATCC 6205 / CBS 148.51 / DSM 1962 / NBRC 6347 / NRRL 1970) TaxID=306901 RepID=Q2GUL1_CHAGB|nr:uncharacterized protein CHGG_08343 [Chaetomium globosum CBS 148.51]EAQ84329.1 predicted protein [Chaetomium globosum CBS 148.51]
MEGFAPLSICARIAKSLLVELTEDVGSQLRLERSASVEGRQMGQGRALDIGRKPKIADVPVPRCRFD